EEAAAQQPQQELAGGGTLFETAGEPAEEPVEEASGHGNLREVFAVEATGPNPSPAGRGGAVEGSKDGRMSRAPVACPGGHLTRWSKPGTAKARPIRPDGTRPKTAPAP